MQTGESCFMSNVLPNLYSALSLEIAAVTRYVDHQERTSDPRVLALLQGLMRNEDGHQEELIERIQHLGGDPTEAANCPGPTLPGLCYDGDQIRGQKTNMAMLRADLAFEQEATRVYGEFAHQADEQDDIKLFSGLARAERGHINGLRNLIQSIEKDEHPVTFFCPICGWALDFGTGEGLEEETRCKMCGVSFTLSEVDGDYRIEKKTV